MCLNAPCAANSFVLTKPALRGLFIPMSNTAPLYFPGLNAIRLYAAFSVIVVHTAINFGELREQSAIIPLLNALVMDAQTAVTLFFVLSGFLITTLLLIERKTTSTVSVRRFYVRRILRIWPLYYLVTVVGFVLLPVLLGPHYELYDPPLRSVVLVLVLLPNLVGPLSALGHLWTIGLEEQFYLLTPWLVKKHRLIFACSIVIVLKLALEPVLLAFNSDAIMNLFLGARFEAMAIGAIGAWLYHQQHRLLRLIYHPVVICSAAAMCVYLALVDMPVSSINTFIISVGFALLIVNVATNPRSPLVIETPFTTYWGVRSYGLYIYHFPVLFLTIWGLVEVGVPEGDEFTFLLYLITFGVTFALADVSYRWLEQPLLRLKTRFAVVQSATG